MVIGRTVSYFGNMHFLLKHFEYGDVLVCHMMRFYSCKNENFQMNNHDIPLLSYFDKDIDCWCSIEPPNMGILKLSIISFVLSKN